MDRKGAEEGGGEIFLENFFGNNVLDGPGGIVAVGRNSFFSFLGDLFFAFHGQVGWRNWALAATKGGVWNSFLLRRSGGPNRIGPIINQSIRGSIRWTVSNREYVRSGLHTAKKILQNVE